MTAPSLPEAGASAAPLGTFVEKFTKARHKLKIKWRTQKDHLQCDTCARLTAVVKDRALTGSRLQLKALKEYNAHWAKVSREQCMYYDQAARSRRPGSRVLSFCTDKAASQNTAHPHIARNKRTKSNGKKAGKFGFSLQGCLQHGHALQMYGLYPWISTNVNYW